MSDMIGHNITPFEALSERANELAGGAGRCVVVDQETAGKTALLIKQINEATKAAKKEHKSEKEPHLEAGRAVDTRWKPITQILADAKSTAEGKLTMYQREEQSKADAERRRLEEKSRREREAAEKAASEGNQVEAARLAQAAEAAADTAEKTAPAEIRSDYGQLASTTTKWHHEVEDMAKLPAEVVNSPKVLEAIDKVIAGMIRAGVRDISGVRIWSEQKAIVR